MLRHFVVTHVEKYVVGVVELLDGLIGVPVDAVKPELLDADAAVACKFANQIVRGERQQSKKIQEAKKSLRERPPSEEGRLICARDQWRN
jgi:hypothetical protein